MPRPKAAAAEVVVEPRVASRFTWLCYAAVLISAVLLFEVELIIGKFLLPWFGGVPAVWITCLLFFQLILLAGYSYAHQLAGTRSQVQAAVHSSLLGVSLLLLIATAFLWRTPITPGPSWKPYLLNHPTWQVLRLLAASIGIPFLLLSATAPLLQSWFAKMRPDRSAYPLYALSNFGSLLALLAYPSIIEPNFTLLTQGWAWSAGYLIFALLCAGCAAVVLNSTPTPSTTVAKKPAKEVSSATPLFTKMLWVTLAACASAMLLAVTNMVCQEVAVVPLLWVLPLAIYLITFIACFAQRTIYRRWWVHPLFAMAAMVTIFANRRFAAWEIGAYLVLLFSACMACHGELVRLKPTASQSTSFYFWIAFGGAIGSAFVSLIAPQIFVSLWELPVALLATEIVIVVVLFRDRDSWLYESAAWLPVALVWGLLLYFRTVAKLFLVDVNFSTYSYVMMAVISIVALILLHRQGAAHIGWFRPVQFFVIAALGMLTFYSVAQMRSLNQGVLYASRNFFGVLRVSQDPERTTLKHGRTFHGMQMRDPSQRDVPTSYYLAQSGVGVLLQNYPKRALGPMRVGVVGLGVGTLAAYGRVGDYYRFYDINPAVYGLSKGSHPYFTYLNDSPAKIDVELGDARLLLEAELARGERQNFDVIALDAFNSDSIPVHLLTQEAVELYLQHLQPDGVLAVHISNRSINLAPVLAGVARQLKLVGGELDFSHPPMQASRWVLLAKNGDMLNLPGVRKWAGYGEPYDRAELWTDDYSNLLHLMVWR